MKYLFDSGGWNITQWICGSKWERNIDLIKHIERKELTRIIQNVQLRIANLKFASLSTMLIY